MHYEWEYDTLLKYRICVVNFKIFGLPPITSSSFCTVFCFVFVLFCFVFICLLIFIVLLFVCLFFYKNSDIGELMKLNWELRIVQQTLFLITLLLIDKK